MNNRGLDANASFNESEATGESAPLPGRAKLRVGFVANRKWHEENRWTNVTTPRLVDGILNRFECCWIQNQADYEQCVGEVDALISMEAGWGAPILELSRTPQLRERLKSIPSYMFYSDPHGKRWREDYCLNNLDYVLAFYDAPTRFHFPRLPAARLVFFPWAFPDSWISTHPIQYRGGRQLTVFGASDHAAYSVRNWCRGFPFVESCNNSGCENKAMSDEDYLRWLAGKDAMIAAGSDDPAYRLTTPKYFEIAAVGALLFAQATDDLARLGFQHLENCVVFNRSNFEQFAQNYLEAPEKYLEIRRKGRELIRTRHSMSVRLDYLEEHVRDSIIRKSRSSQTKPDVGALVDPLKKISRDGHPAALISKPLGAHFTPKVAKRTEKMAIVTLGQARLELRLDRYLDRELLEGRLWEPQTTTFMAGLVKPGMKVLDVGANFGYFTTLLSQWVGASGRVIAFEPTREYGQRLREHTRANALANVQVEVLGLSDQELEAQIQIGECSATMHWAATGEPRNHELIRLVRLDDWWAQYLGKGNPDQLDFIKVDVDGHELRVLRGGQQTLLRLRPALMIEFSRPNFEKAGYTADQLADYLENELGYVLYREDTARPFANRDELVSVADRRDVSANVFCLPRVLRAATVTVVEREPTRAETEPIFTKPEEVYLASADRMDLVLKNVTELRHQEHLKAPDTYATVIGGLSGLNYLEVLNPKQVVFYDVNETMLGYARMMCELIGFSESPEEFIGRIFSRSVLDFLRDSGQTRLCVENQDSYLASPVDTELLADTITRLSPASAAVYKAVVKPYLSGKVLDGFRNCRRLLPCWPVNERVPVGAGQACGTDERGKTAPNTNTFFYGLGWLGSTESFQRTKEALQKSAPQFRHFDLLTGDFRKLAPLVGDVVLHLSNIDDWFPADWPNVVQRWQALALPAQCRLTLISSHNGLNSLPVDAHTWAFAALAPHVGGRVVEVTHKVPWGFYEFDRVNVAVTDYLSGSYPADTTILHILLGEGVAREDFRKVYEKALKQSERVLVLEHNRESADWGQAAPAHFTTQSELKAMLLGNQPSRSADLIEANEVRGEVDVRRNVLFVLKSRVQRKHGTAAIAKASRPSASHISPEIKNLARRSAAKPRVLLIADVPNWIFARHCRVLDKYLSNEFQFTTCFMGQEFREEDFDLIYPLEWNLVPAGQIKNPAQYITGIRSHLSWGSAPFLPFIDLLRSRFQAVHVVSQRLHAMFHPFLPDVRYITHGVDTEFFAPSTDARLSGKGKIRVGWAGNRVNPTKGFEQFIKPLAGLPGVQVQFCGYQDKNLDLQAMRSFYDSIDAYICSSSLHHEGNNNSLMEAASMKRAIITSDNGTVPEYLRQGQSALIVERELPNFIRAVLDLRDNPDLRVSLGEAARNAVRERFEWREMAEHYRQFFRNALAAVSSWRPPATTVLVSLQHGSWHSTPAKSREQGELPDRAAGERFLKSADDAFKKGDLAAARLELRQAVKHLPEAVEVISGLGSLAFQLGDHEEALSCFRRAVQLRPGQSTLHVQLAMAAQAAQNAETFISALAEALRLDSGCRPARHLLARSLMASGNLAEAARHYMMLTQQDPGDVAGLLGLSECFATGEEWESAVRVLEAALAADPGNATVRDRLAEARPHLESAVGSAGIDQAVPGAERAAQAGSPATLDQDPTPLVSVIVPTYNRPEMLEAAVCSILRQTFQNFEVIVVNDAGCDVRQTIDKLGPGDKIRYLRHETNKGLGAARNTGIAAARGRYVAYLDDDDIYYPEHLQVLVDYLRAHPGDVAYTDAYRAVQEQVNGDWTVTRRELVYSNDWDNDRILIDNFVPVLCFMHEKAFLEKAGLFDEQLKRHEDWDLWIRLSRYYPLVHIPKITCEFSFRPGSGSMTGQGYELFLETMEQIHARYSCFVEGREELRLAQEKKRAELRHAIELNRSARRVSRGVANTPQVSIVIPTFNKLDLTRQCLQALYQNTPSGLAEIIVVDNGSIDGTRDFLAAEQEAGRLRAILNAANLGYARASNMGAWAARTPYLVFLNNDTEARYGWLEPMLEVAENDPRVGAVGSKLLFPNGTIQHAGVAIFNHQPLGDPFVAQHIFYGAPEDSPKVNTLRTYPVLTAACLLIPAPLFRQVGGFDEEYWNGYEDVDLCFKIGLTNRLLVYQPASVLLHYESQSGPERFCKTKANVDRMYAKWLNKIESDFRLRDDKTFEMNPCSRIREYSRPEPLAEGPYLVSIVILAHNQLEDTRKCLESIAACTPLPHEVLMVDNGSNDGTAGFLDQWQAEHPNTTVIRNRGNSGFAAGNNQALGIARGEFVVLLNNDTIVTKGWLEGMKRLFDEDPLLGLVGPMTNYVVGPQLVPKVEYRSPTELQDFADRWRHEHRGETIDTNRVIGFCMMIRRSALDKVGGLDPVFNSGNFEDDDYCLRAAFSGFKIRIAKDVFIHHTGSQTFKGAGIDYRKAMLRNWDLFKAKWHLPARAPIEGGYKRLSLRAEDVALRVPLPDLRLTHLRSVHGKSWIEVGAPTAPDQPATKTPAVTIGGTGSASAPKCFALGDLSPARELLAGRRFDEAWHDCCAAVKARPFHPEGFMLLAQIAESAGDWAGARACAEFARKLAPGWKAPRKFLSRCPNGGVRPAWLVLPEFSELSRLSVCLIAKNEEKFLAGCLESIRNLAHQIVLVDTGSTDRTVEIAKEHRAEVHHFDWCDDFSAARNAALEHATGDWVLILDADEELAADACDKLKKHLAEANVMAWRLPLLNQNRLEGGASYVPRLFRNAPGLCFKGRVHEQIFPLVDAQRFKFGLDNRLGEAQLIHHGYGEQVMRDRKKVERNLRLLELALQEQPGEPNLLMNLGLELTRSGRESEGLERYREAYRALAALPATEVLPELKQTLIMQFCSALHKAGLRQEVVEVLASPLANLHGGLTSSDHLSLGVAYFEMENYRATVEQMRQCISKRDKTAFAPINASIRTAGPFHLQALALSKLGDHRAAEKAFQQGLEEKSSVQAVRLDYSNFLAEQKRPVEALQQVHAIIGTQPENRAAWIMGAQIALSQPEFLEFACDWTGEALQQLPEDAVAQSLRAEALLLSGQVDDSAGLWAKVVGSQRHPRNLAALIACEALRGQVEHRPLDQQEALATSKAFFDWYRKFLSYNLGELVAGLNERIDVLREVLPQVAQILGTALEQAAKPEEEEACCAK